MPVNQTELIEMFVKVLKLSNVDETQSLAVLKSHYSDDRIVQAAMGAALRLKAKAFIIELPSYNPPMLMGSDMTAYCGDTALTGNKAAQNALESVDIIIDTMMLLHSPEQEQILKSGTRILLAVESPEVLCRMLPNENDKKRAMAARDFLAKATRMNVRSDAGTDFTCELGQYPSIAEYGYVDEPGRWDHWPSGFVFTWGNQNTAQGKIVLDIGDIILPFKTYCREKITLIIKDGYITEIQGGFEADYLRDYMSYFKDADAFGISHIGWGLQPRAQWTAMGLHDKNDGMCMDARAFYGNFLFSTGPDTEVGGTRKTPCHMDIPLRHCTITLDDIDVVVNGNVVAPKASLA